MLMISNFPARKLCLSVSRSGAQLLIVFLFFAAFASQASTNSLQKTTPGGYVPLKTHLIIESVEIMDMDEDTLGILGKKKGYSALEYDVLVIRTARPVNLLGAATPVILVNRLPVVTKFKPYENSTFYGFVRKGQVDGLENISLVWPDLEINDKRNDISEMYK